MSGFRKTSLGLAVVLLILLSAGAARAAWVDGQAADLVLGQADFTHNAANRGGAAAANTLNSLFGVVVDPATGKVFVADEQNNRVLRYASVATLVSGAAAEGVLGQANFTTVTANRGGAVAANTMASPRGLHIEANGRLWVVEFANHRVLWFNDAVNKADGAAADGVLGQADFTHNAANRGLPGGACAANTMTQPGGVSVSSDGTLWVADTVNYRLLRFDNAAAKANGADADGVLGQADFKHNLQNRGVPVAANGVGLVYDLTLHDTGALYVGDFGNHRVLRFDNAAAKANGANADGVLGQADFTSGTANRGGAAGADTMFSPISISIDVAGRLYVSEYNNHRILIFNNAASLANGAAASNVLGQANFTVVAPNRGGAVAADTLSGPCQTWFDKDQNRLWVGDRINNRALMWIGTPDPPVATTGAAGTPTHDSVTIAGNNVPWDGSATVTERGVEYMPANGVLDNDLARHDGAAPSPLSLWVKAAAAAGGEGTFSVDLTGLTPSTTYNYRAYAINAQGTTYGPMKTFTTADAPPAPTAPTGVDPGYNSGGCFFDTSN